MGAFRQSHFNLRTEILRATFPGCFKIGQANPFLLPAENSSGRGIFLLTLIAVRIEQLQQTAFTFRHLRAAGIILYRHEGEKR